MILFLFHGSLTWACSPRHAYASNVLKSGAGSLPTPPDRHHAPRPPEVEDRTKRYRLRAGATSNTVWATCLKTA